MPRQLTAEQLAQRRIDVAVAEAKAKQKMFDQLKRVAKAKTLSEAKAIANERSK